MEIVANSEVGTQKSEAFNAVHAPLQAPAGEIGEAVRFEESLPGWQLAFIRTHGPVPMGDAGHGAIDEAERVDLGSAASRGCRAGAPAHARRVRQTAEQQVARVVAKLKELNPGYDGKEEHKIENGQVVELLIQNTTIEDISPVRALVKLKRLLCGGVRLPTGGYASSPLADLRPLQGLSLRKLTCYFSAVADLSSLRDMPLEVLNFSNTNVTDLAPLQGVPLTILHFSYTQVTDLSPLRGMPLTHLLCHGTKAKDLSPLKDAPLKVLRCDFDPKRDTEIIRSIETLETINGLSVAEFWKEVEAGKIPKPTTNMGGVPE